MGELTSTEAETGNEYFKKTTLFRQLCVVKWDLDWIVFLRASFKHVHLTSFLKIIFDGVGQFFDNQNHNHSKPEDLGGADKVAQQLRELATLAED